MNYAKEISILEKKLEALRSKLSFLESQKRSYEISYNSARRQSSLGTSAMFNNIPVGYAVRSGGESAKRKALSSIEEAEMKIKECNQQISDVAKEIKKLKDGQMETQKDATLLTKGSSIYIKGDATKIDLLKVVKEYRAQEEKKLEDLTNNEILEEYSKLDKEYKSIIKEYALPQDIMNKLSLAVYPAGFGWNTTKVGTVHIPRIDRFSSEAQRKIEEKIELLQVEVNECDRKIKEAKPTLMEKLFSRKKYQERLQYLKKSMEQKKKDYQLEIEELKTLHQSMKEIDEKIIKPFFEKRKDYAIKRFEYIKEEYAIGYMQEQLKIHNQRVSSCNCYPYEENDVYHLIPEEARTYLDENNLRVSVEDFVAKVMEAKSVPEEIKKEILHIFPKKSHDYKATSTKTNKNKR